MMSIIDILIIICIAGIPLGLLAIAVISALGKMPGNRRKNPNLFYDGPERRCKFREACPVGDACRDPENCIFNEHRETYVKLLDLRSKTENVVLKH
jgi:hypothetical protein